jgi:hypothetical protein
MFVHHHNLPGFEGKNIWLIAESSSGSLLEQELVTIIVAEYPNIVAAEFLKQFQGEWRGIITRVYDVSNLVFIEEIDRLFYERNIVMRIRQNTNQHFLAPSHGKIAFYDIDNPNPDHHDGYCCEKKQHHLTDTDNATPSEQAHDSLGIAQKYPDYAEIEQQGDDRRQNPEMVYEDQGIRKNSGSNDQGHSDWYDTDLYVSLYPFFTAVDEIPHRKYEEYETPRSFEIVTRDAQNSKDDLAERYERETNQNRCQ